MTAFPANTAPESLLRGATSPITRRALIDSEIDRHRAATPPEAAEQREVKRLSIAELNALDIEQIRERLERSRPDSRTPFVKALDLIDLPRNAVANLIAEVAAPGMKQEIAQSGDRAAAGLPRIMVSDFLREAGVESPVVRGIVGFVGDVALDPLTYLGGAGIGLKVTSKAGQAVQIGKRAGRQLKGAEKAAARGMAPTGPAAELIRGAGLTPERVTRLRSAAERAGRSEKDVLGVVRGRTRRAIGRAVDDAQAAPGTARARELEAAKRFLAQATPGATQTLRLAPGGQVGSQILRVPFTDIGVQGPAISRAAKARQSQQMAARAGTVAPIPPAGAAAATAISRQIREIGDLSAELRRAEDVIEAPEFATQLDEVNQVLALQYAASIRDRIGAAAQAARQVADNTSASLATFRGARAAAMVAGRAQTNPAQALALAENARRARAAVELAAFEADEQMSRARDLFRQELQGADAQKLEDDLRAWMAANPAAGPQEVARAELDAMTAIQSRLSDAQRNLSNRGDLDVEAALRLADAAQARVTALHNAALASQSTAFELADSTDRVLGRMVASAMGGGPDQIGLSVMAPVGAAIEGALGRTPMGPDLMRRSEQIARAGRQVFGAPRGTERTRQGQLLKALTTESNDVRETVRRQYHAALSTLADPKGKYRMAPDAARKAADFALASVYARKIPTDPRIQQAVIWAPNQAAKYGGDVNAVPDHLVREAFMPEYARIVEFQRSGLPGLHPEAMQDIVTPLIEQAGKTLDELGEVSLSEHILTDILGFGYVPIRLSDPGRRIAQMTARGRQGGTAAGMKREFFQNPRSTHRYRFTDSEGVEHDVFEFELLHYTKLTPAQISDLKGTISNTDLNLILERQAIAKELAAQQAERGLTELTRRTEAVPAGPQSLNEAFRSGRFRPIATTAEAGDYLFEESLPVLMGERVAAQGRATAVAQYRAHVARLGIPFSAHPETRIGANGEVAMSIGGAEFRVVRDADAPGGVMVRIGEQNYRRLDEKIVNDSPFLRDAHAGTNRDMLYPEQLAEVIEGAAESLRTEEQVKAYARAVRQLTTWWKATTLGHLSWTMMNFAGNAWQTVVGSVVEGANAAETVASLTRNSRDLVKMIWHANDADYMASHFIDLPGVGRTSYAAIREELTHHGIVKSNSGSELLVQLFNEGVWKYQPGAVPSAQGLRGLPARARAIPSQMRDEWAQTAVSNARAARNSEIPGRYDQIKAAGQTLMNQKLLARLYAPWFRANQGAEDVMRAGMYLALREQGFDPDAAAQATLRSLFDYQDLSNVENKWLRTVFPFYSWMRLSGGYYLHQMFDNPAIIAAAPKLKENLEEALVGDAAVPEHLRPSWMREQMAVQIGEKPETRRAIMAGTALPTETALQVLSGVTGGLEGAQDFLHYMVSSLNPVVSVPAQLATGQEFFTGRSIGADRFSGDLSATEFALGQVRPFREFGVGSQRISPLGRAADAGAGALAGRLLLGGRIQGMEDERLTMHLVRELKDEETNLRRAIRVAEANGRPSQTARLRLLQVYQRAMEAGLGDEMPVPKWARETLAPQPALVANPVR